MAKAQIVAVTVAVICPDCGVDQPEPDHGSLVWQPHQLAQYAGKRQCVGCSRTLTLIPPKRVEIA